MNGGDPATTESGTAVSAVVLVAAALAMASALIGLGARATYGARTTADEPQYLLTATSIAADGDLDIANQIRDRAYLDYHEITIDPQTVPLDDSGREVSPHDPLLPLLLAAPMAVGSALAAGWVGAKMALAVLAAATAALTVALAVTGLGVGPRAALVAVGAAFVGLPLAGYGTQVYPEMAAAFALLVALAPALRPAGRWAEAMALAAVVALPWLSIKYVPVAAVAGLALLMRAYRRDRRAAAAVVAVAVVAGIVYLVAHQWIYGGWTAYASGDHFVDSGEFGVVGRPDVVGRSRRLVGLLVDRRFGLAAWSPVWLLAPVALISAWGDRRLRVVVAAVAVAWLNATYVALTMHGWWVPGRQVVVVMPLVALALAVWADRRPRRSGVVVALGVVGLVNWWWLAVEASTGRRTLVVDFYHTASPLYRLAAPLWPDGMRGAPVDNVLLVVWAVVLVTAAVCPRSAGCSPAVTGSLSSIMSDQDVPASTAPAAARSERFLPYASKQLEAAVRVHLDAIVTPHGITTPQYTALTVLEFREGLTSAALARRAFVSAQAMSEVVIALERQELIVRRTDPAHARRRLITITDQGRELLDRIRPEAKRVEAILVEGLTADQTTWLRGWFGQAIAALRDAEPPAES